MDFMLALNVTIYGLGIVFLALLVLMVAIMLLTKVFAVVTGRELLSAVPAPSPTLVVPAGMAVTAHNDGDLVGGVGAGVGGEVAEAAVEVASKIGAPVALFGSADERLLCEKVERLIAGRARVVNFAGSERLVGHFVDVTITAALPHSLRGEVVTRQ